MFLAKNELPAAVLVPGFFMCHYLTFKNRMKTVIDLKSAMLKKT